MVGNNDDSAKAVKFAKEQFLRQLKQRSVDEAQAMWLVGRNDVIPMDFVREQICKAIDEVVTRDNIITSKLVEPVLAEVIKTIAVAEIDKLRIFIQRELGKTRDL
jgi:hypothetical protein